MQNEPKNRLRRSVTCDIAAQSPDASLLAVFRVLDKDDTGEVKREDVDRAVREMLKLEFGTAATAPKPQQQILTNINGPSTTDADELVAFETFVEIFRAQTRLQEDIEASHLARRWLALCDVEINYTVDFPHGEDDHITIRPHIDAAGNTNNSDRDDAASSAVSSINKSAGQPSPAMVASQSGNDNNTADTAHEQSTANSVFQIVKSLAAGGAAGATAKTVIAPLDRTKIIFQASERPFSLGGAITEIKKIFNNHGFRALWKGHSATLCRVVPYAGIQFVSFDFYKSILLEPGAEHLKPASRLLAGAMAGASSVAATYPLDLIRAQMAVVHSPVSKGAMRHTFKRIVTEGGYLGLYRGLSPTLIGILPYSGLAFGSFETLKQQMSRRNRAKGEGGPKGEISTVQRLASGACAGLIAQTLTYPLDIVRRRMQTDGLLLSTDPVETRLGAPGIAGGGRPAFPPNSNSNSTVKTPVRKYLGVRQTLLHVWDREGLRRGLFKGVSMNWIKGPIAVGISFTTFDFLKKRLDVQPVSARGK